MCRLVTLHIRAGQFDLAALVKMESPWDYLASSQIIASSILRIEQKFFLLLNDSETFRTIPNTSEAFRKVPKDSELFRTFPIVSETSV